MKDYSERNSCKVAVTHPTILQLHNTGITIALLLPNNSRPSDLKGWNQSVTPKLELPNALSMQLVVSTCVIRQ